MKLPNINYQWGMKDLTMQDASAPVKVAQAQADKLQRQAQNDAQWASVAAQKSDTARAWGKVYQTAGSMPVELASIAEKYDSARADAKITAKMTEFSMKYNDPSKKFFTPAELDAEGINYEAKATDINGNDYTRQEIPKHEIYAQAQKKYADEAYKGAKSEFGWLSFSGTWEQKTQKAMMITEAEAKQKEGKMAYDYLNESMDAEVKAYVSQGMYGAALKALEGCLLGDKVCNTKRLDVVIQRDIGAAQDAMVSGDIKRMEQQRALLSEGKTRVPKDKVLGLVTQLTNQIDKKTKEDETAYYSNKVNQQLNNMDGQTIQMRMNYAKTIKDPKERKLFNEQLKARIAMEDKAEKEQDRQLYNESIAAVYKDPTQPINPAITDGNSRKTLESLRSSLLTNNMRTDPEAYADAMDLISNPKRRDEMKNTNIAKAYANKLSMSDLKTFIKAQNDIENQKPSGIITDSALVKSRIMQVLGISKPKGDKYNTLTMMVNNRIIKLKQDGEVVNQDVINKVVTESQKELKVNKSLGPISWESTSNIKDIDEEDLQTYGIQLSKTRFPMDYQHINELKRANIPEEEMPRVLKMMERGRMKDGSKIPFTKEYLNLIYKGR